MIEITHDPSEYIRGIQQILISDKKRIGFLFGAGSSLARKNQRTLTFPAIGEMTKNIVQEIRKIKKFKIALDEIKTELGEENFNIETILSNLEQKAKFISTGTLNSLKEEDFEELIIQIKQNVRKIVSVHLLELCDIDTKKVIHKLVSKDIVEHLAHNDFANWIGQAERKYPVEIFTTNYDFLFELGLEAKEIPYYDGFCGSLRPFFNPESVEDTEFLSNQTKLWKIHGSLGWHYDKDTDRILRVNPDDEDILIYPSTLKYKDSKKQPFESLLDRLTHFVKTDDAILITCGYSWGDEHINSRILSALKTNTTSHVIGLIHGDLEENSNIVKLALDNPKISIYGYKHSVIGCKYGPWKLKSEPSTDDTVNLNLYFDEDGPTYETEKTGEEKTGGENWTGYGGFILGDFGKLVVFLNSMINENVISQIGRNAK